MKKITIPIFKVDIYYIANKPFSEVFKALSETYKPGYQIYEYGEKIELEYNTGTTGRVFCVADNTNTNVDFWFWALQPEGEDSGDIGWLAHECMHLTTEILRQAEIPLTPQTEEVYAYLLEYITTEITSLIWSKEL